ncbi:hypothetical protein GCM10022248_42370 [Nonomuraea soli]
MASKSFSTFAQNAWLLAWSPITGYIQSVTVLLSDPEPLPPDPHPASTIPRAAARPAAASFLIGAILSFIIPVLTET